MQFHLLESSRLLERSKSFAEQDVTRSAEIVCLVTVNEVKTRFSNDTKEEILHDIEELLGNDEEGKQKEPSLQKSMRPRYLPPVQERGRQRAVSSSQADEDDDPYGLKACHSANSSVPNFKKKPMTKSLSFE